MTQNNGFQVIILSQRMDFIKNDMIRLMAGIIEGNAAFLNGKTICLREGAWVTKTTELDINLWHKRLSHQNYADIHEIYKRILVTGLEIKGEQNQVCEPCIASKMHANPFVSSQNRAPELLDLIHSNVHDVGHLMFLGFQYWVTFINDHSQYWVVTPIKNKSDILQAFKKLQSPCRKLTWKTYKSLTQGQRQWILIKWIQHVHYTMWNWTTTHCSKSTTTEWSCRVGKQDYHRANHYHAQWVQITQSLLGGVSHSSCPHMEQMPYKVQWRNNSIPTLVLKETQ